MPVRPLGLLADLLHAGPGETIAADANAVADRASTAQHVIQVGVRRIDDDGARRLLGRERDFLTAQVRRQLHGSRIRLLRFAENDLGKEGAREVPWEEIGFGYESAGGTVVLTDAELTEGSF